MTSARAYPVPPLLLYVKVMSSLASLTLLLDEREIVSHEARSALYPVSAYFSAKQVGTTHTYIQYIYTHIYVYIYIHRAHGRSTPGNVEGVVSVSRGQAESGSVSSSVSPRLTLHGWRRRCVCVCVCVL